MGICLPNFCTFIVAKSMKYLFIIQGEGRGHLTQALSLRELLINNGHEVVAVLVGKSKRRELPAFFSRHIGTPVKSFESPNFLFFHNAKRPSIFKTIFVNLLKSPVYLKSICFIRRQVRQSGADVVINFYDLLAGISYAVFPPRQRLICIAHQYLFLHPEFKFPEGFQGALYQLRLFTYFTCIGASKLIALSFYQKEENISVSNKKRIVVTPPLLRKAVLEIVPEKGNYLHGYLLNDTYEEEVIRSQSLIPDVDMHFFWDRKDAPETLVVNDKLTFHRLNDTLFIQYMAGSMGYATTAGFESVCEAIYLGKPVLMVPVHIEQLCNAFDAMQIGAGVIADRFDLPEFMKYIPTHHSSEGFREWVKQANQLILKELKIEN